MEGRIDFQPTILSIQYHVGMAEQMPRDEMENMLRELFDEITESYTDFPGMQCILLNMAFGDIRYMESEETGYATEIWSRWTDEARLNPKDLPEEEVKKASKIVFGKEDAFVYRWE